MGRIHGKRGRIYLGIASDTAVATPLPFQVDWEINHATPKEKVTAMEDDNEVYVAGLPDATGSFNGFYDDASAQTYTAATDGLPRKFYLYPNRSLPTQYWFGTILPDFAVKGGSTAAVAVSSSWSAASSIAKVG